MEVSCPRPMLPILGVAGQHTTTSKQARTLNRTIISNNHSMSPLHMLSMPNILVLHHLCRAGRIKTKHRPRSQDTAEGWADMPEHRGHRAVIDGVEDEGNTPGFKAFECNCLRFSGASRVFPPLSLSFITSSRLSQTAYIQYQPRDVAQSYSTVSQSELAVYSLQKFMVLCLSEQ